MKKVLNYFLNALAVIFFILIIAAVIMVGLKIHPYIVLSGSMEPTIHTGSVCFIDTKASYDDVKKGDIIAYQSALGKEVTHRAIAVTSEGIETKGDNNDVSDGVCVTEENFKGQNIFYIPYVGYVLQFLNTSRGKIIAATAVICIFLLNLLSQDSAKQENQKK